MLGTLELLQSHPALKMWPWWRKGSGLTWLLNSNDAANEQDGSKSDAKPSRDSQLRGKAGTTKLLFQRLQNPKPFPCTTASAGDAGTGKLSSQGMEGGSSLQPFHPTHTLGMLPWPTEDAGTWSKSSGVICPTDGCADPAA